MNKNEARIAGIHPHPHFHPHFHPNPNPNPNPNPDPNPNPNPNPQKFLSSPEKWYDSSSLHMGFVCICPIKILTKYFDADVHYTSLIQHH